MMDRIENDTIEYIREIPRRYERMFKVAKEFKYGDELCKNLAAAEVGKDAVDAINLFLDLYDSQEDDLK